MTNLPVLDNYDIATPCPANWEQMRGSDRVRHCGQCDKNVYDLTKMSEDEIFTLIAETNGNFCGRLYKRSDGKVLLEDCPVGLRARASRAVKRTTALAAMALSAFAGIALSVASRGKLYEKTAVDGARSHHGRNVFMGFIEPIEVPEKEIIQGGVSEIMPDGD